MMFLNVLPAYRSLLKHSKERETAVAAAGTEVGAADRGAGAGRIPASWVDPAGLESGAAAAAVDRSAAEAVAAALFGSGDGGDSAGEIWASCCS